MVKRVQLAFSKVGITTARITSRTPLEMPSPARICGATTAIRATAHVSKTSVSWLHVERRGKGCPRLVLSALAHGMNAGGWGGMVSSK